MHAQSARCEPKRTWQALEQHDAKVILQDLDLPAHRGLRNAQLLRRTGEAEVARSRLEDDQTIRGR
jgi:DNA-binding NarL/FixJ family response regulator